MQNQNIFYEPHFPQYDPGIYGRYNNLAIPYKYPSKSIKRCNYCFSSEEENYNSNAFYFLTDKNTSTINQNYLNRLATDDIYSFPNPNSQNNYKDYNYQPISVKKMENNNKLILKENDPRMANCQYIPLRNRDKGRNQNGEENICHNLFNNNKNSTIKNNKNNNMNPPMNSLKKKYSSIAIGRYNPNRNNLQENGIYSNRINNQNRYCNQHLTKHNSHSLFSKDYKKNNNNNTFNNELNTQNNYEDKPPIDFDKEIEMDSKTFCNVNCTINTQSQTFTNNFKINTDIPKKFEDRKLNTDRPKNCDILNKNKAINTIYKSNNLTKIIKNKNSNYKPSLNKNESFSQIENFENKLMKNNFQNENENKKKINLVINTANNIDNQKNELKNIYSSNKIRDMKKVKKISLVNIPNWNDNLENKNNHSFYETKSLSKDYPSQKNMKVKNNNFILSLPNKNNELKLRKNNEKLIKVNTNNIVIGDNYRKEKTDISMRKINSSELNTYLKNEGKSYLIQKETSKSTFDNINNTNKSEISNKENININTINMNPKISNNNNNYIIGDKLGNNKKIIIKVDTVKFNNFQGNIINKKITNNGEHSNNYNEYIVDLKVNKRNNIGPSGSTLYIDTYKPIKINKIINCNVFSYFPKTNENINNKKYFDKKNLIQLLNINNKTYEEDFPLNAMNNTNNINYLNKNLKSQISARLALFGNKKQEKEKYYLVNVFYSENIRDKPEESESDF